MDDSEIPARGSDSNAALEHPQAGSFVLDRFLLHHVLRMARQMGGDFESLMIWSVLDLQRAANALGAGPQTPATLAPASLLPDAMLHQQGLRSSDLALITGVPRETVRRKLERLQAGGKVKRYDDGRWHAVDLSHTPAARAFARDTAQNFQAAIASLSAPGA